MDLGIDLQNIEKHYRFTRIKKKSGGYRNIEAPDEKLKAVQRKILEILYKGGIKQAKCAHGFAPFTSIVTHAKNHIGAETLLVMDLKDFFPSVKDYMVRSSLVNSGLDTELAELISKLCCIKRKWEKVPRLPQGAPTSPFLSNVAFKIVDHKLAKFCKRKVVVYSRYADDLVFSSHNRHINKLYKPLVKIINEHGFWINTKKTRVLRNGRRKEITGIVVNEKLSVRRTKRRVLRAKLHNIYRGLKTGEINKNDVNINVLRGEVAFVRSVNSHQSISLERKLFSIEKMMLKSRKEKCHA